MKEVNTYPLDGLMIMKVSDLLKDHTPPLPNRRLHNILENGGIVFVGQLVRIPEDKILKRRNMGKFILQILLEVLSAKELTLGMDVPMGPIERAVVESIPIDRLLNFVAHPLVKKFKTVGEIANAERVELQAFLQKFPPVNPQDTFESRMGHLSKFLKLYHVVGKFEQ
jgi:hypothetical protein